MSGRGRTYPSLRDRLRAGLSGARNYEQCWEWIGTTSKGYGQIKRPKSEGGRTEYVHRVAYELHHGVSLGLVRDGGPMVLHTCDNRRCANPEHLFLGDAKVNFDDMVNKGRRICGNQKGTSNPGNKLSEDTIRAIREANGSHTDVAERFGISTSWCWSIRTQDAWKHLK
jgi:hypothetical protein